VSGPAVIGVLTPRLLVVGFGLAMLLPVVPFSLEMYALRRLTTSAFGTLMCLEPAFALAAGFVLLGQVPRAWSLAGVAVVIAAGLGAERYGARTVPGTRADPDAAAGLVLGPRRHLVLQAIFVPAAQVINCSSHQAGPWRRHRSSSPGCSRRPER
jgi:hypothetical protein